MLTIWRFQDRLFAACNHMASGFLPLCARVVFAGVLLIYFWSAAQSKLGDGAFGWLFPADGAYVQIFPRQMEAVSYDITQLGLWPWLVTMLGTCAEFLLPALILVGLFARFAALGMIVFVIAQSLTDYFAHGLHANVDAVGAWFDNMPGALLLDQRALWLFPLLVILCLGGGWLSIDRMFNDPVDGDVWS